MVKDENDFSVPKLYYIEKHFQLYFLWTLGKVTKFGDHLSSALLMYGNYMREKISSLNSFLLPKFVYRLICFPKRIINKIKNITRATMKPSLKISLLLFFVYVSLQSNFYCQATSDAGQEKQQLLNNFLRNGIVVVPAAAANTSTDTTTVPNELYKQH